MVLKLVMIKKKMCVPGITDTEATSPSLRLTGTKAWPSLGLKPQRKKKWPCVFHWD